MFPLMECRTWCAWAGFKDCLAGGRRGQQVWHRYCLRKTAVGRYDHSQQVTNRTELQMVGDLDEGIMVVFKSCGQQQRKEWDQEDCGSLNFKLQRKSEVRDHLKIHTSIKNKHKTRTEKIKGKDKRIRLEGWGLTEPPWTGIALESQARSDSKKVFFFSGWRFTKTEKNRQKR